MKILHVGWWTIEYRRAGGSIIHVETIMEELAKRAYHNIYFCGGRYNLLSKKTYLKRWQKPSTWVYEVVNSPNLISSHETVNFHIGNKILEELFQSLLDKENPDIIHFHELESLTGSLLSIARERKIPFVVGVCNYWYLCPQRDLFERSVMILKRVISA
ncbi:MAG: glycosyltransferase [Syntrophobacterales bacterium]|nr:glycosyltransferase [Syntrophobacterales bacterium]